MAILVTLLLGAAACDAAVESDLASLPSPEDADEIEMTDVAVVEYDGGKVSFHELTFADGSQAIAVSDQFDNRFPDSPLLAALEGRHPTSGELFQALRPGEDLPAAIAAHQGKEASARGRSSAAFESIDVVLGANIEKVSTSVCDAWIYPNEGTSYNQYVYTKKRRANSQSGTRDLAVGNNNSDFEFTTFSAVTMGACSNSTSNITAALWVRHQGEGWQLSPAVSIPPGSGWIWLNFWDNAVIGQNCGTGNSDICLPIYSPTSYAIRGTGNNYHLRTALSSQNPPLTR